MPCCCWQSSLVQCDWANRRSVCHPQCELQPLNKEMNSSFDQTKKQLVLAGASSRKQHKTAGKPHFVQFCLTMFEGVIVSNQQLPEDVETDSLTRVCLAGTQEQTAGLLVCQQNLCKGGKAERSVQRAISADCDCLEPQEATGCQQLQKELGQVSKGLVVGMSMSMGLSLEQAQ